MRHQWSNIQELVTMRGKPVYTSDGEKLGDFEEIYHDEATGQSEWIRVRSATLDGILGTKHFLNQSQNSTLSYGANGGISLKQ